jgi:tetratricopeptide (TPR) repeat protein
LEGAIEAFTKSIQLDPDKVGPYKGRGRVYIAFAEYPQALEEFTKAIELDPDSSYAYNNRGIAYSHLGVYGSYSNALQDYDKAIQLDPDNGNAYLNRCNIYRRHLYDEAKWKSDRAKAQSLGVGGC